MALKDFQGVFSLFIILALVVVYFRYIERRTIFYPKKQIEYSPKELGLDFEDVFFKTSDSLNLNGWFLPTAEAKYTLLFCHGNAGNISHRIENLKFFQGLGLNIFIFDYRGYGRSQGRPSENGLYVDIQAAYDYLLSRGIKPQTIIGFGKSLGGAVIIDLAAKNPLGGLIVSSTFSSAKDMAKIAYPFLPSWILSTRFEAVNKIRSITIPKLIIHSTNDEIVPYKLGEKLYTSAAGPKEFVQIRGGHNDCFFVSEEILKEKIADFLKRLPQ